MNMNCERIQLKNGRVMCSIFDDTAKCQGCNFYTPAKPEKPSRDIKDIGNTTYWRKK